MFQLHIQFNYYKNNVKLSIWYTIGDIHKKSSIDSYSLHTFGINLATKFLAKIYFIFLSILSILDLSG